MDGGTAHRLGDIALVFGPLAFFGALASWLTLRTCQDWRELVIARLNDEQICFSRISDPHFDTWQWGEIGYWKVTQVWWINESTPRLWFVPKDSDRLTAFIGAQPLWLRLAYRTVDRRRVRGLSVPFPSIGLEPDLSSVLDHIGRVAAEVRAR